VNRRPTSSHTGFYRIGRRAIGGILLAGSILPGACDDWPPGSSARGPYPRIRADLGFIAFVGAGEGDPLWPILKTSAQRYAHRLGEMEVRYLCPAGNSPQDQIDVLQSLNDPDMRGLCIQIINAKALTPIFDEMHNRGIRIVSMIRPAPERYRVAHVGFDEAAIGEALADVTAKVLDGAGSIMLLHAGYEHPIYGPRLIAFEKQLSWHREIEVYAKQDCQTDARRARRIIRERSQRFPRLSAWVALDDWPIRDLGLGEPTFWPGCKFITFGGTPAHWILLQRGTSPAIVAANYRDLGAKGVQFCEMAVLHPSRFTQRYAAPLRTVLPTNLEEYQRDWAYWSTGKFPQRELQP